MPARLDTQVELYFLCVLLTVHISHTYARAQVISVKAPTAQTSAGMADGVSARTHVDAKACGLGRHVTRETGGLTMKRNIYVSLCALLATSLYVSVWCSLVELSSKKISFL